MPNTAPAYKVIGAGIIGLSTAWMLHRAQPTARISIIDPAPISGASHWAAGMLAPTAEMQFEQDELVELMVRSMELYPKLVDSVQKNTNVDTGYNTEGTFVAAADAADRQHLHDLLNYQHSFTRRADMLTLSEARRLEPALSPNISGVVSIPDDFQINPRQWCSALIDALKSSGVVDFESRPATDEDLGPSSIVCAGLGASSILSSLGLELPLRPVFGEIMRLDVPAIHRPILQRVVRGFVNDRPVYVVPRTSGELVIGATSREDGRDLPQAGGVLDLLRDAARIVPSVRDCDITEVGCGARPGTPHDMPYIFRHAPSGTVVSTGYFRHGILLSALGAQLGSALLLGTDSELDAADVRALELCGQLK